MADFEDDFDVASLVDAAFGAAPVRKAEEPEPEREPEPEPEPEPKPEPELEPEPEPEKLEAPKAVAETATPTQDTEPSSPTPAPAFTKTLPKLTRGRLAAAAAVVVGVAVASVVLLSGGGSGNAATQNGAAGAQPSVNPQAFYPVQSASAFETGAKSELTDAELQGAVSGCDACKLVTRANGFTPDSGVLALFRTGEPEAGRSNAKLVAVGGDGKLLWSAPDGFKALTAGIERFSVDGAGNFYLALPGARTGQVLVALAWRDGKVQDLGGLLDPRITSDSIVGVLPQAAPGADATIVSQSTAGIPDAATGGLVESQYRIENGAPVLIGCRRHVGESGQWIAFQPSADGCKHWPAGPVGPPDDDDDPTAPVAPPS
ncbi:hypothetical protein GCM10009839_03510 [Catenulispora yoronensis]|uniref:Uncharacterized protein n=1 Tax=Catenulispora yoronensis TaxID=450799 RepID=A0ABP5EZC2_9ACTN